MTQASLFDGLPDVPRARTTDPGTSHAAAASVDEITRKQAAVALVLAECGACTDATLVTLYQARAAVAPQTYPPQSSSGIRTRRSELVAKQRVRDSGARVRLDTGRHAIVWTVAP